MLTIRLIYKLIKDGKEYYLWNKGSYEYSVTDFSDNEIAYFNDMGLDEVLVELREKDYMVIELI